MFKISLEMKRILFLFKMRHVMQCCLLGEMANDDDCIAKNEASSKKMGTFVLDIDTGETSA